MTPPLADLVPEPTIYDALAARQRGDRDLPIWVALANDAGGPVLELGAGTGRVLSALLAGGIDAVGIDLDEDRIAAGANTLLSAGLPAHRLTRGDARTWRAEVPLSMVLAPYNFVALCTEPDLHAVLTQAHANLRPGGRFVCEAQIWPLDDPVGTRRELAPTPLRLGDHTATYSEVLNQHKHGLLRVARRFAFADGSVRISRQDLRLRSVDALRAACAEAGFTVQGPALDESGTAPTPASRVVYLVVARE